MHGERRRRAARSFRAAALLLLVAAASWAHDTEAWSCREGDSASFYLEPGKRYVVECHLPAGEVVELAVEQQGVDLALLTVNPAGEPIVHFDGPTGDRGTDTAFLVTEVGGPYRLEVVAVREHHRGTGRLAVTARRRAEAMDVAWQKARHIIYRSDRWHRHPPSETEAREAVEVLQAAVDLAKQSRDLRREAEGLLLLASVQGELGRSWSALLSRRRSADLFGELGDTERQAYGLLSVGFFYFGLGDPQTALDYFHFVADRLGSRHSAASPGSSEAEVGRWYAQALYAMGLAYLTVEDLDRACEDLAESLAAYRRLEFPVGQLKSGLDLARCQQAASEWTAAEATLRSVLPLTEGHTYTLHRRLVRQTLAELAKLVASRGRRQEAIELLQSLRATLPERPASPQQIRQALAEAHVYQALGDRERALQLFLEAARGAPDGVAFEAWLSLAEAAAAESDWTRVREAAEEAILRVESNRRFAGGAALGETYVGARHRAYELAVAAYLELADARFFPAGTAAPSAERALELHEHLLGRGLLDALSAKTKPEHDGSSNFGPGSTDLMVEDWGPLEVASRHRELALPPAGKPAVVSLDDLRGMLDRDTLFLSFALGDRRSHVFAVDHQGLWIESLPSRSWIDTRARSWLAELSQRPVGDSGNAAVAALGHDLARVLLAPVAPRLGRRRVLIAADGVLGQVPLGALPGPAGRPLVIDHEVTYVASASVWARLVRRPRSTNQRWLTVVADPLAPHLAELPGSRREAREILELAPPGRQQALLGGAASRDRVLPSGLDGSRIVHFAGHAFAHPRHPELSGLVLAASSGGTLHRGDLEALDLGTELVVMAACDSAASRSPRSHSLDSLAAGFLAAGARAVVGSLWQQDDEATAELMSRFYRILLRDVAGRPALGHRSVAAALAVAQREMASTRRFAHPFYWSGFIVLGDGSVPSPDSDSITSVSSSPAAESSDAR